MSVLIDETEVRTPSYRPDVPVKLDDGQVWHLPKPIIEFRLAFDPDAAAETPQLRKRLGGFGPDYPGLVDAFWNADGVAEQLNKGARLAVYLLKVNYSLTNDQISDLLPYRPDDDGNMDLWKTILDVCTGTPSPLAGAADDTSDSPL